MYKVKHAERQFIVVRHVERVSSSSRPLQPPKSTQEPVVSSLPILASVCKRMIARSSIIFLTISIVLASAEEFIPDNVFPDKRGSIGFQGMYGKSNLASWGDEELSKRAPMGFQGMRGKKSSIIGEVENELLSEETKKRAPMGFQGMRGKKNNLLTSDFGDTYPHDDYEKRAPMGFQGMRGKKTSVQDEYYKRAPMGFQGMRGKKSFEQMLDEINEWSNAKRKETYSLDYPDDGERRSSPMDPYQSIREKKFRFIREWEKKAPMGFQGMRGKKMISDTPDRLDKGNVMDFHGRRDTFDNYVEYPLNPSDYERRDADFHETGSTGESFKRTRMAFHGTRSKRDAADIYKSNESYAREPAVVGYQDSNSGNNLAAYEIEKRSPFGFPARRRKKNRRWELLGKFVGVRGKKSSAGQTLG